MRSIASSRAAPRSPGSRRGPPIPATASQKLPAPIPSSNRPPLITSSDAAAFASIVGGRIGQARDVGEEAQPRRASEQVGDERERVQEAPLIRVILDADEVEPGALRGEDLLDDLRIGLGVGRHRDPERRHTWVGQASPREYPLSWEARPARRSETGIGAASTDLSCRRRMPTRSRPPNGCSCGKVGGRSRGQPLFRAGRHRPTMTPQPAAVDPGGRTGNRPARQSFGHVFGMGGYRAAQSPQPGTREGGRYRW